AGPDRQPAPGARAVVPALGRALAPLPGRTGPAAADAGGTPRDVRHGPGGRDPWARTLRGGGQTMKNPGRKNAWKLPRGAELPKGNATLKPPGGRAARNDDPPLRTPRAFASDDVKPDRNTVPTKAFAGSRLTSTSE